MTYRPVIFSGPMVRALLDGRKTMTRRLAWREHHLAALGFSDADRAMIAGKGWNIERPRPDGLFYVSKPTPWQKVRPGDRLWVRESFATAWFDNGAHAYMADWRRDYEQIHHEPKWKPSIHMPRQASRLTLIVTATKIERLQDISEEDARAEGALSADFATGRECALDPGLGSYRLHFADLWRSLHGAESWNANPEVVALTFTVHQANIDQMERAA